MYLKKKNIHVFFFFSCVFYMAVYRKADYCDKALKGVRLPSRQVLLVFGLASCHWSSHEGNVKPRS